MGKKRIELDNSTSKVYIHNNSGKKFEVFRIKALKSFEILVSGTYVRINKGDLGGWVTSDVVFLDNSDSWVDEDSYVLGKVEIGDCSYIKSSIILCDEDSYILNTQITNSNIQGCKLKIGDFSEGISCCPGMCILDTELCCIHAEISRTNIYGNTSICSDFELIIQGTTISPGIGYVKIVDHSHEGIEIIDSFLNDNCSVFVKNIRSGETRIYHSSLSGDSVVMSGGNMILNDVILRDKAVVSGNAYLSDIVLEDTDKVYSNNDIISVPLQIEDNMWKLVYFRQTKMFSLQQKYLFDLASERETVYRTGDYSDFKNELEKVLEKFPELVTNCYLDITLNYFRSLISRNENLEFFRESMIKELSGCSFKSVFSDIEDKDEDRFFTGDADYGFVNNSLALNCELDWYSLTIDNLIYIYSEYLKLK